MNDTNYYEDAKLDANRGAVVEDMLDALHAAQREVDDLRWQVEQAGGYGSYMRHCLHPVTFAEWVARRRALLASEGMADADALIARLRERGYGVQP